MEIEVLNPATYITKSFNGAAHVTQLLTLMPNAEDKNDKSNLKVSKGLSGYIKVTHKLLNEDNSKPQTKNIIRNIPVNKVCVKLNYIEKIRRHKHRCISKEQMGRF